MFDVLTKKNELLSAIEKSLSIAKKLGATQAEAGVHYDLGFTVQVRCGEVENVVYENNQGLTITVYSGHKKASASTNDLSNTAINLTIEKVYHIAKETNEDQYNGLPNQEFLAYNYPNLDLYHPTTIDVNNAINLAKECESLCFAQDKNISNSEGATVSTREELSAYGNSLGFIGSYPSTIHALGITLIAGKNDHMQRDGDYTVANNINNLVSVTKIAENSVYRTIRRLNPQKITTRNCPVIFEADVAKSLLSALLRGINGYNIYQKSSFLLEKLGKKIFPDYISISEKPHLPMALGSAPFDAEGVQTKDKYIIQHGILENYILDTYSGRHLNMPTTGNAGGIHNLFMTPSNNNLTGLLKIMKHGLLVTELLGQGPNIVTGDYSRAAFGFWVENGIIQYPVTGITIASNLSNMFSGIVAVGNDIDYRSNIHTGSILIENMMVGGN